MPAVLSQSTGIEKDMLILFIYLNKFIYKTLHVQHGFAIIAIIITTMKETWTMIDDDDQKTEWI